MNDEKEKSIMFKSLPIESSKEEIVNAIENNDVTIISAETGSGKSTMVPQYLFERGYDVIVTEPRRIAAISLANYLNDKMGGTVGYRTGFERNDIKETKILFCTDGLQAIKMVNGCVRKRTVLVIDEAHEWNLNIEMLIAYVWNLNNFNPDDSLKVVIMSATIDCESLSDYFKSCKWNNSVANVHIKGSNFPVKMNFCEQFKAQSIVFDLVLKKKNVLVFLPGKREIYEFIQSMEKVLQDISVEIMPLHSELNIDDQKKVFSQYDVPKVIVSTNIAQTSITIPDIDAVVDFGNEKRIEVNDGIEDLCLHNISKSDCLQRAGRAGRTKEGEYWLCSSMNLDSREAFNSPEIERLSLEKVMLTLTSAGLDMERMNFFHNPDINRTLDAKKYLLSINAIKMDGYTISVTKEGKTLAKMPISVKYSKMLYEANNCDCLDLMIPMVAIMEIGSLVNFERIESYASLTTENRNTLFAELDIYFQLLNRTYSNDIKFINIRNLRKIKDLVHKIKVSLSFIDGFKDHKYAIINNFKNELKRCESGLKRSFLSAMLDCVYFYDYSLCYLNRYNNICYLNTKSPRHRYSSENFVVGTLKTIHYKNKWGFDCSKDIIMNEISYKPEEIYDLMMDLNSSYIEKRFDYGSDFSFDESMTTLNAYASNYVYGMFLTITTYESITKGTNNEVFEHFLKIYTKNQEEIQNSHVILNGTAYEIRKDYFTNDRYIELSEEAIFKIDEDSIFAKDGYKLYIAVNCERFRNISKAKEFILKSYATKEQNDTLKSLDNPIDSIEGIKSNLNSVGELDINCSNFVERIYIGLHFDGSKVYLKKFDSIEECNEETINSLKRSFTFFLRKEYRKDRFIVSIAGYKRVLNDKMNDFYTFLDEVSNELSTKNLEESEALVREYYNELVS